MLKSLRLSGSAALLTGALTTLLVHQLYAISEPFVEIVNSTPDATVLINGDAFETRTHGRLAVPCSSGETLEIRWNNERTGLLCQSRLYIGFAQS